MEYVGLLQATSSHSTTTNALQSVSDNMNFLDVLLLDVLLDLYTCLFIVQLYVITAITYDIMDWIHGCLIRHLALPILRVSGF